MPCEIYVSPDGEFVTICCGKRKSTPCHYCGNPSTSLCDHPIENGKTCDKPLCNNCRDHAGADLDYCREHSNKRSV